MTNSSVVLTETTAKLSVTRWRKFMVRSASAERSAEPPFSPGAVVADARSAAGAPPPATARAEPATEACAPSAGRPEAAGAFVSTCSLRAVDTGPPQIREEQPRGSLASRLLPGSFSRTAPGPGYSLSLASGSSFLGASKR